MCAIAKNQKTLKKSKIIVDNAKYLYYNEYVSMTNASIAQWWSNRLLTGRLQVRALFGAPENHSGEFLSFLINN